MGRRFAYMKHQLAECICNRSPCLGAIIRYPKWATKLDGRKSVCFVCARPQSFLPSVFCVIWLSVATRSPTDHHGSWRPTQATAGGDSQTHYLSENAIRAGRSLQHCHPMGGAKGSILKQCGRPGTVQNGLQNGHFVVQNGGSKISVLKRKF